MLREILMSPRKREPRGDRAPGLSGSQLFPCPYRLYKAHLGQIWVVEPTPQQLLNMEDGWDQEEQSIRRLKDRGVIVENRQRRISVGRSRIPGSIDGTITLNGKQRLWEHKAMGIDSFSLLKLRGLKAFPGYLVQTNIYMKGLGLDEAIFMAKLKDNNDYYDFVVKRDDSFLDIIVEWADRIRLEGWVPEPKECSWCSNCGLRCFDSILDFGWIKTMSAPEMEDKWIKGDQLEKVGSMMKEEARAFFVGDPKNGIEGIIGSAEELQSGSLVIKKVISHRFDISKQRVMEEFGPEGLLKVGEEKEIVQYRFKVKEE